ncbi:sigma-70 family RNA polymerase sigma factor [Sphingomonas morindae]|uniref:Sigma-70 family RNA polymerase sigma factor n=1 Tax=Sphingomonas morindae TaxID=1541170 RepID=A0ABY4XDJ4_9SPHN|nr:sigma-70 family RNA polymerase sigma factor [Sphingomonas morindae]USI75054.1 sigma-70 family RNA polymerase sigma factor [Sphingomonas morindae]
MVIDPIFSAKPAPALPRSRVDAAAAGRGDAWGALMAAAQSGHGGAYQRLLTEISAWLAQYFRRRLPAGEIDDAVQETLMAVHRRRHTYDPRLPLAPWLAGIARRKWIDQLRGMGRRSADALPADLATPGHEAAVTSASVLAGLLDQLRPAQAQVITLVKLHGFSVEDASRETGLSASAVKMNIHRGLARLSSILETKDDVD